MDLTLFGQTILLNEVSMNELEPIFSNNESSEILISFSFLHCEKALDSINLTFEGIVIFTISKPANESEPIV